MGLLMGLHVNNSWNATAVNRWPTCQCAFLICINDMPYYVKHCKVNMYADDTVIYYASNSSNDIVNCIKILTILVIGYKATN